MQGRDQVSCRETPLRKFRGSARQNAEVTRDPGLRDVRAKGKQLGRPKKILDTRRIATLRAQGVGWKRIAAEMGVGVGTIYRLARDGSKIRGRVF
jgi:DNA invertase Pin-like site-specific DNA recombinase